jgi:hypothetical protein
VSRKLIAILDGRPVIHRRKHFHKFSSQKRRHSRGRKIDHRTRINIFIFLEQQRNKKEIELAPREESVKCSKRVDALNKTLREKDVCDTQSFNKDKTGSRGGQRHKKTKIIINDFISPYSETTKLQKNKSVCALYYSIEISQTSRRDMETQWRL